MGFCTSLQKRKLLLMLILKRQWMKTKQRRLEEEKCRQSRAPSFSTDVGIPGPSSAPSAAPLSAPSRTVQNYDNDDLEVSVLQLRRKKLLLEIEKLTEERERITAEKRNIELRQKILQRRGVFKCAKCEAPSKKPLPVALIDDPVKTEISFSETEDEIVVGEQFQFENEGTEGSRKRHRDIEMDTADVVPKKERLTSEFTIPDD